VRHSRILRCSLGQFAIPDTGVRNRGYGVMPERSTGAISPPLPGNLLRRDVELPPTPTAFWI